VLAPFQATGCCHNRRDSYFIDRVTPSAADQGEARMTNFQPELWVERAPAAVAFYREAFGAFTLYQVGESDNIVAQLAVGDACFWVASADASRGRFSPLAIGGGTSRTLLVVEDPDRVLARAVRAGATETSPAGDEHGWRVGRVLDPYGHEWEIGRPLGDWPPTR
jgi:PhnB protein